MHRYDEQLSCRDKKSRHLDVLIDEEIERVLFGTKEPIIELFTGLPIRKHFEGWLEYLGARGLDPATVRQHRYYIENFIFLFFSKTHKPNPKEWAAYGARFYSWLEKVGANGKPVTASQIKMANIALRKFYGWLGEEGHVAPMKLKLRLPVLDVKAAVLPRPVLPEEVLSWARSCESQHVKIIGLAGYFFSLRPQEIFALMRGDFRAGDSVLKLECSRVMAKAGLFERLVVHVGRQQQNSGNIVESAKKGSNGWVACFNIEAAKLLLESLASLKAADKLMKWNNHKLYTDWNKFGIKGVNVKDRRRASFYYLGHYSNLTPLQLMKHARHREVETTMLYCRRPDEILDLDDAPLSLGI